MPRSKPKTGTANFTAVRQPLHTDTRSNLIGLLGLGSDYDKSDQRHNDAMRDIENWLVFYAPAAEAFSNLPKPMDYRRAISILEANDWKVPDGGRQFHQRILDAIEKCRKDPANANKSTDEINDAIRAILSAQANSESRGRPKHEVLLKVLRELRKIFAKYYVGGSATRKKLQGAAECLSDREFHEVDFIETALRAANIQFPEENLRRLFVASEVAPPRERNEIIARAAKKVSKTRKQIENQGDINKKK